MWQFCLFADFSCNAVYICYFQFSCFACNEEYHVRKFSEVSYMWQFIFTWNLFFTKYLKINIFTVIPLFIYYFLKSSMKSIASGDDYNDPLFLYFTFAMFFIIYVTLILKVSELSMQEIACGFFFLVDALWTIEYSHWSVKED